MEYQGGRRREPDLSTLPPPELEQAEIAQPWPKEDRADRSRSDFGPVDYPGRSNEHDTGNTGKNITANPPD